jgi:hypothetical protein
VVYRHWPIRTTFTPKAIAAVPLHLQLTPHQNPPHAYPNIPSALQTSAALTFIHLFLLFRTHNVAECFGA